MITLLCRVIFWILDLRWSFRLDLFVKVCLSRSMFLSLPKTFPINLSSSMSAWCIEWSVDFHRRVKRQFTRSKRWQSPRLCSNETSISLMTSKREKVATQIEMKEKHFSVTSSFLFCLERGEWIVHSTRGGTIQIYFPVETGKRVALYRKEKTFFNFLWIALLQQSRKCNEKERLSLSVFIFQLLLLTTLQSRSITRKNASSVSDWLINYAISVGVTLWLSVDCCHWNERFLRVHLCSCREFIRTGEITTVVVSGYLRLTSVKIEERTDDDRMIFSKKDV